MGRIVVGVDGSETSDAALRWALDEGQLRRSVVEAVLVYDLEAAMVADYPPPSAPEGVRRETAAVRERAQRVLDEAIKRAAPRARQVQPVLVEEEGAAHGLIERSRGADLLVVGSRGRGGFKELLLGSVSSQCANYARCPVVIVRPETEPGAA